MYKIAPRSPIFELSDAIQSDQKCSKIIRSDSIFRFFGSDRNTPRYKRADNQFRPDIRGRKSEQRILPDIELII